MQTLDDAIEEYKRLLSKNALQSAELVEKDLALERLRERNAQLQNRLIAQRKLTQIARNQRDSVLHDFDVLQARYDAKTIIADPEPMKVH